MSRFRVAAFFGESIGLLFLDRLEDHLAVDSVGDPDVLEEMNVFQHFQFRFMDAVTTKVVGILRRVREVLFTPKKTEHGVKIVNVFKKIRTIVILMRKDMPNPGKLVW